MNQSDFSKSKTIKNNTFYYHPGRKGWFWLSPLGWLPATLKK